MESEAAFRFVETLAAYLSTDPLTSEWLLPLEPMLAPSYRSRFDVSPDDAVRFLVYDDSFPEGRGWLSPGDFYTRSRGVAERLAYRGWIGTSTDEDDLPTGAELAW